jgi:hypothetical protein
MAADTYTVERSVRVAAPADRVYAEIADFRNWPHWSPWEDVDPALERTYSGSESGVGAVYAWSGNRRAGRGRMEILEANAPSHVRIDLVFEKPFKARNDTAFTIAPSGSGAQVTWTMTGRRTLATKVIGIFRSMDSFLGPDFERGLAQLKATVEQAPPA